MKRHALIFLALVLGFVFSQRIEAQQVCGPEGCYNVEFQPVRNTINMTRSVVESVSELPPVPVTYAVVNNTVNRSFNVVRRVRTQFIRPLFGRVFKPVRKLFCR